MGGDLGQFHQLIAAQVFVLIGLNYLSKCDIEFPVSKKPIVKSLHLIRFNASSSDILENNWRRLEYVLFLIYVTRTMGRHPV